MTSATAGKSSHHARMQSFPRILARRTSTVHRGLTRCAASFGEMCLSLVMKWLVATFYRTESWLLNGDRCLSASLWRYLNVIHCGLCLCSDYNQLSPRLDMTSSVN